MVCGTVQSVLDFHEGSVSHNLELILALAISATTVLTFSERAAVTH